MLDDTRYAAVLAAINEIRAELDLPGISEIPKGRCGNPFHCPVANALDAVRTGVTSREWWDKLDQPHDLPPVLREFITDFDAKRIPELIADEPSLD